MSRVIKPCSTPASVNKSGIDITHVAHSRRGWLDPRIAGRSAQHGNGILAPLVAAECEWIRWRCGGLVGCVTYLVQWNKETECM
jgi:hypothetical protein